MGMAYGGCCCRWYWAESKSISLCCSSSSVSVSVADATKKRLLRTCGRPMVVSLSKSKSNDDDIIISDDDKEDNSNSGGGSIKVKVKGSGTTARGRRLLRIREEKQQREYDRLHNYPAWAKSSLFLPFTLLFMIYLCRRNKQTHALLACALAESWKMLANTILNSGLFWEIVLATLNS